MKPGKLEALDIDDTFCAAHGGQQLAFWNAHHDERGFASMHIYHVASGTPVAAILRPARTPKGSEVCTVIKHVTKRLRRHWPKTRLVWRGDSHYGRVEAMDWAEGLPTDRENRELDRERIWGPIVSASCGAMTAPTQSVFHEMCLGGFSAGKPRRNLLRLIGLVGAQECESSDAVSRFLPQESTMRLPVVPRALRTWLPHRGGIIQRSDHVLFRDSTQFGWTARFPTLGGQDVAQVMGSMGPS